MLDPDLQELTFRQLAKTLKVFTDAGITPNMLAYLRENERVVKMINNLIIDEMMPFGTDKELFSCFRRGEFFGLSDWNKFFKLNLTEDVALPIPIEELEEIMEGACPFTGDKKVRETHFLFYLPRTFKKDPLSIKKFMELYPAGGEVQFFQYLEKYKGSKRSLLETSTARYSWYLMFKGVIPGSSDLTLPGQLALKPKGYEVAKLIECTAMHFLLYEKNGVRVDETKWGRTCDSGSVKGKHISAGGFSERGYTIIEDEKDCGEETNVGIYFFRKLEK